MELICFASHRCASEERATFRAYNLENNVTKLARASDGKNAQRTPSFSG